MAPADGDRTRYWPAIEARYGSPMSRWFDEIAALDGRPYGEQMSRLIDGFGFSRAHANAVVMYCRGSASSRRVDSPDAYLAQVDPVAAGTVRRVLDALTRGHPGREVVIAWNQPMVKEGDDYLLGVSVAAPHITIAPWGEGMMVRFADRLDGYVVNRKTFRVPLDWDVDEALLDDMVAVRVTEVAGG